MRTGLKSLQPWPADAVIIVASVAGEEKREQMESVVACHCRDCGALLAADSHTIRRAERLPSRLGRPIAFLCVPCVVGGYDQATITELHDDRGRNRACV